MDASRFQELYAPVLREIEAQSAVTDAFLDRELYQVQVALFWASVVLAPARFGIREGELESLHDRLCEAVAGVLGVGHGVRECFEFVVSPAGGASLDRLRASRAQRDVLHYTASLILDPDGHRAWLEAQRSRD